MFTIDIAKYLAQAIYDNNGSRMGHKTKTSSGFTNYFDNNVNRIGHSPANKSRQ